MDEEDKLREDFNRGVHAKALLQDELLQESFAYVKQAYKDAWSKCQTTELPENNWYLLKGIERVEDHLISVLRDGRLADKQIEELVKRPRRAA